MTQKMKKHKKNTNLIIAYHKFKEKFIDYNISRDSESTNDDKIIMPLFLAQLKENKK